MGCRSICTNCKHACWLCGRFEYVWCLLGANFARIAPLCTDFAQNLVHFCNEALYFLTRRLDVSLLSKKIWCKALFVRLQHCGSNCHFETLLWFGIIKWNAWVCLWGLDLRFCRKTIVYPQKMPFLSTFPHILCKICRKENFFAEIWQKLICIFCGIAGAILQYSYRRHSLLLLLCDGLPVGCRLK